MGRRFIPPDDAFTILDWDPTPDRLDFLRQVILDDPAVLTRIGSDFQHPLLSHAVWVGDPAAVALILELGADPNFYPEVKGPPIMYALETRRIWRELALPLVDAGADLEWNPPHGTALHTAVLRNDPERVRFVVDHGGQIDARAEEDRTPLWQAANFGFPEVCRVLLDAGADPTLRDCWYQATPAEIARQSKCAGHQAEMILMLDAAVRHWPARRGAKRNGS